MSLIVHITSREDWERARLAGQYEAPSLATQGFIHCSRPDQVISVADSVFRGQHDLVLLCIDTERLVSEVRRENCEGGASLFPHVYGPVNLAAVAEVIEFPPREDGSFELPKSLCVGRN